MAKSENLERSRKRANQITSTRLRKKLRRGPTYRVEERVLRSVSGYIGWRSKSDSWEIRYRLTPNSKARYHGLGKFTGEGLTGDQAIYTAVLKKALEFLALTNGGEADPTATVRTACEGYIIDLHRRSERAFSTEVRLIRTVLGGQKGDVRPSGHVVRESHEPDPIANIPFVELKRHHIEDWLDRIKGPGSSNSGESLRSCNHMGGILAAALNRHAKRNKLSKTEFDPWPRFEVGEAKPRPLVKSEEIDEIIATAKKHLDEDAVDILLTLIALGARGNELCQANIGDFDVATGILQLTDKKGKSKKPRRRPVHCKPHDRPETNIFPRLVARVRKARLACPPGQDADELPLFTRNGARWASANLSQTVRHLVQKKAGLPHVVPYSFRDYRITALLNQGMPTFAVAKFAGTAEQHIRNCYDQSTDEMLGNLIEAAYAKSG